MQHFIKMNGQRMSLVDVFERAGTLNSALVQRVLASPKGRELSIRAVCWEAQLRLSLEEVKFRAGKRSVAGMVSFVRERLARIGLIERHMDGSEVYDRVRVACLKSDLQVFGAEVVS